MTTDIEEDGSWAGEFPSGDPRLRHSSTPQDRPQFDPFANHPSSASSEARSGCPFCGSSRMQTRDRAMRLCAALGAIAGALGGTAKALAGAELGAELGAVGGSLAAGPPGAALGLVSGAVLGALVAAAAGCTAGVKLGAVIDRMVLHNVRCLDCDRVSASRVDHPSH